MPIRPREITSPVTEQRIKQIIRQLLKKDEQVDHGGLGGLGDDDHTQYLLRTEIDDFYARDTVGGQSVTGSDVVLNINSEVVNTDAVTYILAADILTVGRAGTMAIEFRVAVGSLGSGDWKSIVRLQEDSGGGFADIPGAVGHLGVGNI